MPQFQLSSKYIHFENHNSYLIHKHATGIPLEMLFSSFGIQMRMDNTIQIGKYTLEAKCIGYDSEKIICSILDGMTNKIQSKDKIVIPRWIKNNAKWWVMIQ